MNNYFYLIGRLTTKPVGNTINLAVNREYKNDEGIYETDFFNIILTEIQAKNMVEYCEKGDLIGIKGTLESKQVNESKYNITLKATKVSFLAARKDND